MGNSTAAVPLTYIEIQGLHNAKLFRFKKGVKKSDVHFNCRSFTLCILREGFYRFLGSISILRRIWRMIACLTRPWLGCIANRSVHPSTIQASRYPFNQMTMKSTNRYTPLLLNHATCPIIITIDLNSSQFIWAFKSVVFDHNQTLFLSCIMDHLFTQQSAPFDSEMVSDHWSQAFMMLLQQCLMHLMLKCNKRSLIFIHLFYDGNDWRVHPGLCILLWIYCVISMWFATIDMI